MSKYYAFISFILLSTLTGCNQINLFPITSDKIIGELYDQELINREKVVDEKKHPLLYSRINSVKDEILKSPEIRHKNEFSWTLRIVKNDSVVNAFCAPGGYIYVYTGLINFLESTDQLAGILGHEIAHADLRHSTRQLTKTMGLRVILYILGFDSNFLTDLFQGLVGLNFSREHETEADEYSVRYLRSSRYNPKAIVYFFNKISKEKNQALSIQFLSTHPNPSNRSEFIKSLCQKFQIKDTGEDKDGYQKILELLPS